MAPHSPAWTVIITITRIKHKKLMISKYFLLFSRLNHTDVSLHQYKTGLVFVLFCLTLLGGGFFVCLVSWLVWLFFLGQGARAGSSVSKTSLASNSLIENDLELQILVPPDPECWGCRLGVPCKFSVVLGLGPRASCRLGKHTTHGVIPLLLHQPRAVCILLVFSQHWK